jgi:hypothetical protein
MQPACAGHVRRSKHGRGRGWLLSLIRWVTDERIVRRIGHLKNEKADVDVGCPVGVLPDMMRSDMVWPDDYSIEDKLLCGWECLILCFLVVSISAEIGSVIDTHQFQVRPPGTLVKHSTRSPSVTLEFPPISLSIASAEPRI